MKINGHLLFNADGTGRVQNAFLETTSTVDGLAVGAAGRFIYQTGAGGEGAGFYYSTDSAWIKVANASILTGVQTEIDAVETSLGAGISSTGTFVSGGFTSTFADLGGAPTSFTDAINKLAIYSNSNNQLSELDDVDVAGLADKGLLQYNSGSGKWEDVTVAGLAGQVSLDQLGDVDLTGAAAGSLIKLVGSTWTDVTIGSDSGVQKYDAGLDALADKTSTGILVQTGADTFASREIVVPTGMSITNADGVAGNPTIALANDLAALEGLSTTGIIVRTGDGSAVTREVVGSDGIAVSSGTGVSANITLSLDATLVSLANTTDDGIMIRKADGTMVGKDVAGTANRVVVTNGSGTDAGDILVDLAVVPFSGTAAFSKFAVDSYGRVTTSTAVVTSDITALVDATYVNASGDSMSGNLAMGSNLITGLGAPSNPGDATNKSYVDSVASGLSWKEPVQSVGTSLPGTATTGDRFLNTADGKVYTATATNTWDAGVSPADGWALFDRATETGYVYSGSAWVQFTGAGQITAGVGMSKTGNVLDINLGAGVKELPTDEVGLDLYSAGGLLLTTDGSAASTSSAAQLAIAPLGVTNAMLAGSIENGKLVNSSMSLAGDQGTVGSVALGGTITFDGVAAQGVDVAVTGSTAVITVATATTSALGVAKFSSDDFAVAVDGTVTVKASGIDNAQLANSSMTFGGDTGSAATSLGGSFDVKGSGAISTAVVGSTATVSVAVATDSVKGVASFSSDFFSVSSGAVSLAASLDDLTNVDGADAGADKSLLQKDGSTWTVVAPSTLMGQVKLGDLGDVGTASTATVGEVLAVKGDNTFGTTKMFHLYDGASATTHVVTHGLGQKYCNVTVVDAGDEVVIPQSITFNSSTQLTVVFNSAIACKIVVMGIATA